MDRQNLNEQRNYLDYMEKQIDNHIDLSTGLENPNDSVRLLAEKMFSTKPLDLRFDAVGLLFDDSTEPADIFCAMIEFVLYGLDILSQTKSTIFMLEESTDDVVYLLRSYLKGLGLTMVLNEIIIDDDRNINMFRDRDDFFCEITSKPPPFLCYPGWYVLNYRFIENKKFKFDAHTKLSDFKALFMNKKKRLFSVGFDFYRG
jgi:hypothetical protein